MLNITKMAYQFKKPQLIISVIYNFTTTFCYVPLFMTPNCNYTTKIKKKPSVT